MTKFVYLIVLFLTVLVPAVLSGHKSLRLYSYPKALAASILVPSAFFWIWDIAATARGHWSFNPQFVLGLTVVNLPIEEYLFFLVVGFVSIFTYEVVKSRTRSRP